MHAGFRWELEPGFAPLLEPLLASPGERIKVSPVKEVTRHHVGGRTFYLKRYHHAAVALRPLKYLFKPTQAREEWRLATELERRGVPIVRHVGLGERRAWNGVLDSLLVTEEFPGTTLNLCPEVPPALVLKFVERMHALGVMQEDLHPANLLARTGPLELRLVDLHGTRVAPAGTFSAEECRRNLAVLQVSYPMPVPREIRELSRGRRLWLLSSRSVRSLRSNRDFGALPAGGLRWQVRLELCSEAAQAVMADPDGFLARRCRLLKNGRSSTVGLAEGMVLKRFNLRKPGNLLKDLFRASRARRAFLAAHHLELAGIPTPRGIAVASRRRAGFLLRSYLLMEEIAGAVELGQRLREGPPGAALARQAGQLLGRLHREGFSHRDLKEGNLVLDASGRLHLLDLDGLRFLGEVPPARALADLERFAEGVAKYPVVTAEDRTRFLLAYHRASGLKLRPKGSVPTIESPAWEAPA